MSKIFMFNIVLLFKMKTGYVYILTNKNNTVLYTGVTSNLVKRVYQHKNKVYPGFSAKYNCNKLVYFETFDDIREAIRYEKKIKAGNRKNKERLINNKNPDWRDLAEKWYR